MHKNCEYKYRELLCTFTESHQLLTFYAMKTFLSFFHSLQSGEIFISESLDSGLDTVSLDSVFLLRTRIFSCIITENYGHLTLMQYNYLFYSMYSFLSTALNRPFITFLVCLFATQEPTQDNALCLVVIALPSSSIWNRLSARLSIFLSFLSLICFNTASYFI